jgi:YVTN family beta-propeller protein
LAVNKAGTQVAVPFRFTDNVLLLNPVTGAFVAEITHASFDEPFAVAYTPDDAELWVANKRGGSSGPSSPGSVSVVDIATESVVAVIDEQSVISPEGITIANGKAYVANRGRGSVTIIDVATRTVLDSLISTDFGEPRFAVATPDGQFVYVSTDNSRVVKISTATDAIVTTIMLGDFGISGSTRNLAVSPDGTKVYAGLLFRPSIAIIDVATDTATELTFTGASSTYGVAVLRDGSLGFVTDESFSGEVWVFDLATGLEVTHARFPISVGSTPRGIAAH